MLTISPSSGISIAANGIQMAIDIILRQILIKRYKKGYYAKGNGYGLSEQIG
jgi:hypothetical protein